MRWHKRIRLTEEGIDLAADINAVLAVNRGRPETTTAVNSTVDASVTQDSRRGPDPGGQPDDKERR